MSQQSMRKAARLAASDTHPSRTQGADWVSRAVPIEVQDHHLSGVRREAIGRSADVHRSQRRLRNSVLSGRFRCTGDRAATDFAVPSDCQRSTPRSRS